MKIPVRFSTLLALVVLSLITISTAAAQDVAWGEVGVDYNYVHTNAPPAGCGCFSMNGADGWFAYNLNRSFSVVGQLASQHASNIGDSGKDLTLTSFLFGPRYNWRRSERFVPFGQLLIGPAHASGSFAPGSTGYPGSSNAFAMSAGAGIDLPLKRNLSVRAFQLDYYLTRFDNGVNDHQNNIRVSAGLLMRLGKK